MNGPVDRGLEVANGAISALKTSPMMLSLVLLQLITLGAILYNSLERQKAYSREIELLTGIIQQCIGGKNADPR